MIDGSHHPLAENIKMTKEVVDYAHARGVSVEAELGTVGGNEDGVIGGIKYADCGECVSLCKDAEIDALAPALGSVHGPYKGEPVLRFKEMEEIGVATQKPLVLHGGTGIPDELIKRAISLGTCKINVNTECQLAFNKILRDFLADPKNAEVYDPRKLLGPATKGIVQAVTEKMNVFGSVNKN
jgi:ketose-bisphosphate aldolase